MHGRLACVPLCIKLRYCTFSVCLACAPRPKKRLAQQHRQLVVAAAAARLPADLVRWPEGLQPTKNVFTISSLSRLKVRAPDPCSPCPL
jgi:hypothetical protein